VVVPAWLHGLDWAGDPFVSVRCARRRTELLNALSVDAGLDVLAGTDGIARPALSSRALRATSVGGYGDIALRDFGLMLGAAGRCRR